MPKFHDKPFDEGTLKKLHIYKNYLNSWLPVFLSPKNPYRKTINIYDFFAGPGYDKKKVEGSPMIAIRLLHKYFPNIVSNNLKVNLFLNDADKRCYEYLMENIGDLNLKNKPFEVHITNLDFPLAFERNFKSMKGAANLIFLDQTGVKQVTKATLLAITSLPATDFLFFISSSFFNRFHSDSNFNVLNISGDDLKEMSFFSIHRLVLQKYRDLIPSDRKHYLAPYSIKKGSHIYGLIFGSQHLLGMEKFLNVCWKDDELTGEADFDIDKENLRNLKEQYRCSLFPVEDVKSKKIDLFEHELETAILNGKLKSDKDVCIFSIENGFLAKKHAEPVVKGLVSQGKIELLGIFAYTYRTISKTGRNPIKIKLH